MLVASSWHLPRNVLHATSVTGIEIVPLTHSAESTASLPFLLELPVENMSYYDNSSTWSGGSGRQPSWEQPPPPSRSGTSSTVQRDDLAAFASQFEEIDRAADNLMKSGKMFAGMGPGGRRDSLPIMGGGGRQFGRTLPSRSMHNRGASGADSPKSDGRMGGSQRHHSVSDDYNMRPNQGSNLQGYYQSQRFGPRAGGETDQMMQAKRRMAAQRERELRNYHQEQQYNRSKCRLRRGRNAGNANFVTLQTSPARNLIGR